jgi:hypothetical protein
MKHSRSRFLAICAGLLAMLVALFSLSLSATSTQSADTTDTPSPTPTLTATASDSPADSATSADQSATAAPTQDERVLIQVVARVATFHTGPGPNYAVVAQVRRGNKIELSGISEDGTWYMFKYSKKNTWITADPTITKLILGDPGSLPVIEAPPTPTPRPAAAYSNAAAADDGGYNASTCDFDNTMSPEAQDALLQQVYSAVDANDWLQAGQLARRLYRRCPLKATFYLLYTVYLPNSPNHGVGVMEKSAAFALFQQGWKGQ